MISYIAIYYHPKMAKRGLITKIKEVDIESFKNNLTNTGDRGFPFQFSLTNESHNKKLLEVLKLSTKEKIINKKIEVEELDVGDVIFLATPTQSSVFRYFIITFYK